MLSRTLTWCRRPGAYLTVVDEFYKMGPGPSSSHDWPDENHLRFLPASSKLPEDQLKRATAVKVHLFGSLSATGKDTARTALTRGPARQIPCDLPARVS